MSNPVVVDLSHWNPTPDWAALKANGTVGVIHKATEGSGSVDATLFPRAADAIKAGLKWSTYHFLRPGNMKQQMDFYLKTVNPVQGERVCLDHEDSGVSLNDLKEAVDILCADSRNLQVALYSGHVIKEQLGSKTDEFLAAHTSLWLSHYTTGTPSWPKQVWPQWSLWQYTDAASYVGISAKCDGNKWNGSPEALLTWFGPASSEPVPQPKPQILVAISGPFQSGAFEWKLTVNGEPV
jgi:lysozyme